MRGKRALTYSRFAIAFHSLPASPPIIFFGFDPLSDSLSAGDFRFPLALDFSASALALLAFRLSLPSLPVI